MNFRRGIALVCLLCLAIAGCGGGKPKISRDQYDQLRIGMTYKQVVATLGPPDGHDPNSTVLDRYVWTNPDGSWALFAFNKSGVLQEKFRQNLRKASG